MGRDLRMPGFRKGKVPAPVVIQRIGRDAVLDEAVRGSLGRWYVDAIDAAGIHPVGEPDVDLGDLPAEGQPLTFTIEIGVRPIATLGDISTIEAPRREAEVDEAKIDEQIDRLREQLGRLETVERAAADGDYVGHRLQGLDRRRGRRARLLRGRRGPRPPARAGRGPVHPRASRSSSSGAAAGEERVVEVTFPEDYGSAPHLAGQPAQFEVTVNEVKAKQLPELDDDFATEAGGFDTVAELREDIATRMRETEERQIEAEFREAALDAVVEKAEVEIPDSLVEARARELFEQMLHSLSHRGITKEAYLADRPEDRGGAARGGHGPTPSRRCAARRCWPPSSRPSPSSPPTATSSTRCRGPRPSRAPTPEKLRKRLEQHRPPGRAQARTWPSARPSSC